ncbi:hypothetical protein [Kitasatospora sp. KL5]|uniref:hypothetical protein n=1 Tax=Kitasatospora sp. KL5 TaxID=3425125 RepID=UPI003D6EC093
MLVLQGAYTTPEEARRALEDLPEPGSGPAPRLSWREWLHVVGRMAYVLGVISPGSSTPTGRLNRYLRWVAVTLLVLVGIALPFVWVPVLGVAYRSATLRLATRASVLFGLVDDEAGPATRTRGRGRVRPLALLVFLRTVAVLVIPFAVSVIMVFSGTEVVGHRWLAVAVAVVGVSLVSCLVWRFRQWRRGR